MWRELQVGLDKKELAPCAYRRATFKGQAERMNGVLKKTNSKESQRENILPRRSVRTVARNSPNLEQ
jgi:hypothetical protein